jgi:hypothetical protein
MLGDSTFFVYLCSKYDFYFYMRKTLLFVLMLVASAMTALAADSKALQSILRADTYAEVESLINSQLNVLPSNQEKAKAYNHLTRLAVLTFYDESVKRAVDKRKVMELGLRAMRAADLCDEYDMQPGADGQVRPKYRDDNYISIALLADAVVDGCCEIAEAKNYEQTLKYIDAFCHYAERPLLKKKDLLKSHPKIDLIGFYGGQAAFMLNKFGRAAELFKLAMNSGNESVRNFAREYYSISLRYAQQGQ